jgi:hypothetical protein
MRIPAALALLLTSLVMLTAGCGRSAAPDQRNLTATASSEWQIAFWAWTPSWGQGYETVREAAPVDEVYVRGQFGLFPASVNGLAYWPDSLPRAKRYWALWRLEDEQSPLTRPDAAEGIGGQFASLQLTAVRRRITAAGLQIDFDCPSGRLRDYATWLAVLRTHLPRGARLSITALLDWFRPGTAVAEVLRQVDEFVPQFYDARPASSTMTAIAEPIDTKRWAPVFNRFRVPYRIGISSFGRVLLGRNEYPLAPTLLQLMSSPAFDQPTLQTTPAGERRVLLKLRTTTTIEWTRFEAGKVVQIVLPTQESVAKAYAEARKMGGYCTGAVFFRWPTDSETTVLSPTEVLRAIGVLKGPAGDALEVIDGDCAAVRCSDLYLQPRERFPLTARTVVVRASGDLEYFLANPKAPRVVSMTARDTVTVTLPALHGESRLYLGRVMSKNPAEFAIEGGTR